mmetsp:Transcript_1441/g.1938  ORF Transcript_1441/g.1938 Transcript_1441/m.1938 type:complete len:551 (+) Transcript_1441:201-1853(+)|eukprot:CAMPEP_0178913794 /NCGR_PEP_ID=MMETSP0786-20121207/11042_1 /TAXON_ID=186022 /ORGANISM="Thalassionema frauenfeldii, Strain CCMP 1798" /LENGTH=550 /DNA_ID=CAMNT_0020586579 /DNA_START=110 /DNA_END=1762 /DNA_ORIENTATION=+
MSQGSLDGYWRDSNSGTNHYNTNIQASDFECSKVSLADDSDSDFITFSRKKKRRRKTILESDDDDPDQENRSQNMQDGNKGIRNASESYANDEGKTQLSDLYDSDANDTLSPVINHQSSITTCNALNRNKNSFELPSPTNSSSSDDDDLIIPPPSSLRKSKVLKVGYCEKKQSLEYHSLQSSKQKFRAQDNESGKITTTKRSLDNSAQENVLQHVNNAKLVKEDDEVEFVDLCESSDSEKESSRRINCISTASKTEGGRLPQQSPRFNAMSRDFLVSPSKINLSDFSTTTEHVDEDDIECWDDNPTYTNPKLRTSNKLARCSLSTGIAGLPRVVERNNMEQSNELQPDFWQVPQSTARIFSVTASSSIHEKKRKVRTAFNAAHAVNVQTTTQKEENSARLQQVSKSIWYRPSQKEVRKPDGQSWKGRNDLVGGSGVGVGALQFHSCASLHGEDNPTPTKDEPDMSTKENGIRKKSKTLNPQTRPRVSKKTRKKTKFFKCRKGGKKWGRGRGNKREVSHNPWGPGYQHQSSSNMQGRNSDLQHVGGAKISF